MIRAVRRKKGFQKMNIAKEVTQVIAQNAGNFGGFTLKK